jgi:hypothetical protein
LITTHEAFHKLELDDSTVVLQRHGCPFGVGERFIADGHDVFRACAGANIYG